ncbi:MAG: gamma-glutamyl-gamma-aminobutyrate hydrolase family protein [Faecalibacterium sp.]|jgi:putative glutamine amidotransferase|nr:gamma-glutamyl-gamma-aminobutyrate hydrolase family protein [Faecalibacterium sp.]
MSKPVIGIPSPRAEGEILARYSVTADYIEQIERAGGIPLMLPITPETGKAQLHRWVALCDGVLLPGGGDLDPAFYGRPLLAGMAPCTDAAHRWQKIELEFTLLAANKGLPILGICLGAQALNVAFGGTLVQDIPTEVPKALAHEQPAGHRAEVTHSAEVKPGSRTARILGIPGGGEIWVNTYHHQAVAQPAPGFIVSAVAPDGVIEAIECPKRHLLGIQWHPENLAAARPEAFAFFQWLIKKAK